MSAVCYLKNLRVILRSAATKNPVVLRRNGGILLARLICKTLERLVV